MEALFDEFWKGPGRREATAGEFAGRREGSAGI
jgi:hypothetical protein